MQPFRQRRIIIRHFMNLEMGSVDAIAMDVIVAGYQLQQRDGGFKILDDTLASEEYAIGFKKGNEALRSGSDSSR